ncbi:chaplin [Allonocardiopsis opalescens]|nr:chaplin [Allonocardiopsis opalescens]
MLRKKLLVSASAAVVASGLAALSAPAAAADTSGAGGVAAGNQIEVPVDVRAVICGNALAALGLSAAECEQVAQTLYTADQGQSTDGSGGIASGNQISIPVDAAIEVCGNSVSVLGLSAAECERTVHTLHESEQNQSTDGSGGIASGNQISIPVDVAVEVCGNSVSVLGLSAAECEETVHTLHESEQNQSTDGSGGIASGNQVTVPVDVAAEICGNSVSVLGLSAAECEQLISEQPDGGEEPAPEPESPDDSGTAPPAEGDDGGQDDGAAEEPGGEGAAEPSPSPSAQPAGMENASNALPVTGVQAGVLAGAAAALVAGGATLLALGRKRRAARLADEG